jgi:hypothetical protein
MRTFSAIFLSAAALVIGGGGAAEAAPWCAWFIGRAYSYDCSYYTLEQCRRTILGVGGYCAENFYPEPLPYPPPRYRKRPPRSYS